MPWSGLSAQFRDDHGDRWFERMADDFSEQYFKRFF